MSHSSIHLLFFSRCRIQVNTCTYFTVQSVKIISSSHSLSCDSSTDSSKNSSPESAIYNFLFQVSVTSLFINFIQQLLTSSSSSFHPFQLFVYLSFKIVLQKAPLTQDGPVQLAYLCFIVSRMFLSSFTFCNTFSFFTRSVRMIFFILLQHHICELSRYFRTTFRSVHISAMLQMQHFISFFLKFKSNVLVIRVVFMLNDAFAMIILDLISRVHVATFGIGLHRYFKYSTYIVMIYFVVKPVWTYRYSRFPGTVLDKKFLFFGQPKCAERQCI